VLVQRVEEPDVVFVEGRGIVLSVPIHIPRHFCDCSSSLLLLVLRVLALLPLFPTATAAAASDAATTPPRSCTTLFVVAVTVALKKALFVFLTL
jgi:hypothetical protein